MTIRKNTFEGGTTGTNLTVAGSGGASGDAFDILLINNTSTPGGSTAIQYLAAAAINGTLGVRCTLAAAISYVRWDETQAGPRYVARRSFKMAANPSASATVLTIYTSATASRADLLVSTAGKLMVYFGGVVVSAATSTATLAVNTLYWLQLAVTQSVGSAVIEYQVTDSSGAVVASWASGATYSVPIAVPQYRFVFGDTTSGWTTQDMDDLQAGPLPTGFLGPITAPTTPPTINLFERATLEWDARGSAAGSGGTLGYSIAYLSGVDRSSLIDSPVAGVWVFTDAQDTAGDTVYRVTVTEAPSGQTATGDITVPHAAHTLGPVGVVELVWNGTALG